MATTQSSLKDVATDEDEIECACEYGYEIGCFEHHETEDED